MSQMWMTARSGRWAPAGSAAAAAYPGAWRHFVRHQTGLATAGLACLPIAIVALLTTVSPSANEQDVVILATLVAVAVASSATRAWLEPDSQGQIGETTFDATMAIAVVALYFGGPLAAFAILLVPDFILRCVLRQRRLCTVGLLFNVTSFGFAVLAGGLVFTEVGGASGLMLAASVMTAFNFVLGPLLWSFIFDPPTSRRNEAIQFIGTLPAELAMNATATGAALATADFGVIGLAVLSLAFVLPQRSLLTADAMLARPRGGRRADVRPIPAHTDLDPRDRDAADEVDTGDQVAATHATTDFELPPMSSERPRVAPTDLRGDIGYSLVALRRLTSHPELDPSDRLAIEAAIRLLELEGGDRDLRAVPSDD